MMFGGGRRTTTTKTASSATNRPRQMEKVKPVKKILKVSLEDIYLGHTYKIPQQSQRCCMTCGGLGGTSETTCYTCSGKGHTIKLVQARQGVYHQTQSICTDCSGKGTKVDLGNACKDCQGLGIFVREKLLEVVVEKGAPQDHMINMIGEGDETVRYR
jgi:DnaJ family protein A protein 2